MPSPPSVENYVLGRGVLYIADWDGDTPPAEVDYTDLGNCTDFTIQVTEEKLEHFSSRSGVKTKDKVVTLQVGYEGSLTLDEIAMENLAYFLRGTIVGNRIKAATALSKEVALKFVSDNPEGPNQTWFLHKCKLTPANAFNLISDEWSSMEMAIEGLSDTANNSDSPYFDVYYATTTTTTTTT